MTAEQQRTPAGILEQVPPSLKDYKHRRKMYD